MELPNNPISITFGDKSTAINPAEYNSDDSVLLKQIHSNYGYKVDKPIMPRFLEGDYLITNTPQLPIAVMTADCLPIIFFDPEHHAAGIAHAGWQGTAKGIAVRTIEHMFEEFSTDHQFLSIYFGPSAQPCCYEVSAEFITQFPKKDLAEQALEQRDGRFYFDVPLYNKLLLLEHGVMSDQIDTSNNHCTICNTRYCSYRREQKNPARQITTICLN